MARNDLNKRDRLIECCDFSFEDSKLYIAALIFLFHIVPLAFIVGGDMGQKVLNTYGMVMFNPIIIATSMLIYGIKQGFNSKMPLICMLLSVISLPMYYSFANLAYMLMSIIIFIIVYGLYAFGAVWIGALIKQKLF